MTSIQDFVNNAVLENHEIVTIRELKRQYNEAPALLQDELVKFYEKRKKECNGKYLVSGFVQDTSSNRALETSKRKVPVYKFKFLDSDDLNDTEFDKPEIMLYAVEPKPELGSVDKEGVDSEIFTLSKKIAQTQIDDSELQKMIRTPGIEIDHARQTIITVLSNSGPKNNFCSAVPPSKTSLSSDSNSNSKPTPAKPSSTHQKKGFFDQKASNKQRELKEEVLQPKQPGKKVFDRKSSLLKAKAVDTNTLKPGDNSITTTSESLTKGQSDGKGNLDQPRVKTEIKIEVKAEEAEEIKDRSSKMDSEVSLKKRPKRVIIDFDDEDDEDKGETRRRICDLGEPHDGNINEKKKAKTLIEQDASMGDASNLFDEPTPQVQSKKEKKSLIESASESDTNDNSDDRSDRDLNNAGQNDHSSKKRVRKKRKVTKTQHFKNTRGMLVSRTYDAWESYSEDEDDVPMARGKGAALDKSAKGSAKSSGSANTTKKNKSAGHQEQEQTKQEQLNEKAKSSQPSLMSFFARKK